MDRFASTSTYDPATRTFGTPDSTATAMATRSIFDKLGRVVGTERYKDQRILIGTEVVSGQTMPMSTPPAGLIGDRVSSTSSTYDAAGRVIAQTDASGLRSETVYLADGRVKQSRAGEQPWTKYAYSRVDIGGGKFIQRDTVTDARGQNTTSERDALGRVTKVTHHDGTYTQTKYGVNGQPVPGHAVPTGQTITGQQVVSVSQRRDPDPTIPSDDAIATQQFYNPAGQLTDVWQPAVDDALTTPTDLVRPRWRYTYDENGNQLTQTDPRGKVTSFAYDERGLRTSRTLPPDSDGNTANDTETWTYDVRGRVDVHTDFKGQSTRSIYETDARYGGRLKEEQRFTGVVDSTPDESTEHAFDSLGRRTTVTEKANLDLDDLTPLQVTRTETTGFDPLTGAVILTSSPEGVVRHAYDPATGRLLGTWTAPDTTSVTDLATARTNAHTLTEFEYNYLGQLWKVKAVRMNGATVLTSQQTTTHTYDSVGNLSTLALPNGVTTTYTYDALNRLDTLFARRGGTVVFSQDYELRNDGQRSAVNETREGGGTVRIDWTYDALNRLTNETYNSSDNTKDYKHTFAFDLAGNRRTKAIDLGINGTTDETLTSAYNDRDQLTADDSTINSNDAAHTYDANGSTLSVTSNGATKKYVWDLRNRMSGYDANGDGDTLDAGDATYGYDASGNRVRKVIVGGPTTHYLIDDANQTGYAKAIEEKPTLTGTPTRTYILGHDVVGQSDSGAAAVYLLKDGHGATRALTDGTGVVITGQSFDFDAFGNPVGFVAASAGTEWLAPDGRTDVDTGLRLNGARYVRDHRFFSFDPAENDSADPITLHKYLYANGNPVAGIDPSGFVTILDMLGAMGAQATKQSGNGVNVGRGAQAGKNIAEAFRVLQKIQNTVERVWDTINNIREVMDLFEFDDDALELFKGELLSRMAVGGTVEFGLPKSISTRIERATRVLGGTSNKLVSEFIGAVGAALATAALGYKTIDVAAGYHGVDAVMYDPTLERLAVVEAKGGTSKLDKGTKQMYDSWIKSRLLKAANKNPGKYEDALRRAAAGTDKVSALVISTNFKRPNDFALRLKTSPGINGVNEWGSPFE